MSDFNLKGFIVNVLSPDTQLLPANTASNSIVVFRNALIIHSIDSQTFWSLLTQKCHTVAADLSAEHP